MANPFATDKEQLITWVLDHYDVRYRGNRRNYQAIHCLNGVAHLRGDKNPSATVNIETGYYKCFSCGLNGDGYSIMRELEGWDVHRVNAASGGSPIADEREGETWI